MEASGRTSAVTAYLRWAAAERLTVVRVLAMAKHLFELPPERGVQALDGFLARAARYGLFVEVVALADTASYDVDPAAHVAAIAEICARHPNAILEIANEPYHSTQRPEVHDRSYLERLRALVPATVPTALGAGDYPATLATGAYVTVHFPRSISDGGWGWVAGLRDAAALLRETRKPVIDDEPMGAGARTEPGRRDADPEKFRAAAIAGRLSGIGATFHYEGGLHSLRPAGVELASFRAWQQAETLIPGRGAIEPFEMGPSEPVRTVRGKHAAVFLGKRGGTAWALIVGAGSDAAVEWQRGWRVTQARSWTASRLYTARRINPSGAN